MNTVEAIYENGVFRPVEKVDLEDGDRVEVLITSKIEIDPAETIPDLAMDLGITDFAENIDYYLYGLPKQTDK